MRRDVFWFVLLAVGFLVGVDLAVAQQPADPAPIEDEPELAADLPLPEHSLMVKQPAGDSGRAYFGVTFDPRSQYAAVARSVSAGSPADEAGVLAGDVIESLNGQRIDNYDEVLTIISRLKPGDVLDFEVSRRVTVRSRAVLHGAPAGIERTAGYRAETEPLPMPAGYQNPAPVVRAPAGPDPVVRRPSNVNAPAPRQGTAATRNRNSDVNRNGNSNRYNNANDRNRGNNGRGGLFRRGR